MTELRAPLRVAPPTVDHGVRIPDRALVLLRDLVNVHTGMYYDEARLSLMGDRLVPLAIERGFDSLLDYYYLLKYDGDAGAEWSRAIDALSVQESYFWRESDQLRALTEVILPRLVESGRALIRIWSIPCAAGEEPLSIAMALEEAGWFGRIGIEIHAGDASEAALQRAALGRYGIRAFRQLPDALRDKYFERDAATNTWKARPALRARVSTWSRVNVVKPADIDLLPRPDVVFCRNLFIYFTEATVTQVVEHVADRLPPRGFLCVGAAESLLRLTARFDLQDIAGAYVYVKS